MNDPSPLMMSRSYGLWPPPVPAGDDPANPFPNPNRPPFPSAAAAAAAAGPSNYARPHWKPNNKGKKPPLGHDPAAGAAAGPSAGAYMPLDHPARGGRAPRRFYKKKHNNNNGNYNHGHHPLAARAPRNTTSYLIRAKRAGGIASLVSPCPVTPAVLPTPEFSPSREALVDTAKEEWGVDGYGSMKGLIRLRSPRTPTAMSAALDADEEAAAVAAEEGSSESDVEEHVEVERRLDHDLSRFEMVYCPSLADQEDRSVGGPSHARAHAHPRSHESPFLLGSPLGDRDAHILRLEEENLTLRDRLFLMERDMADLRRRLVMVEMECRRGNAGDGNSHNNNNNNNDHCNTSAVVEEVSDSEEDEGVCSEKSVGD